MGWWSLRAGIWVIFLLALLGNGTVLFINMFSLTKMDVTKFLICNLAAADFMMGVYLGFLAIVDASTLGECRSPLLKQLHWLPVDCRIKFKLSILTYRTLAINQPPYLNSLLHFSNVPRQLRSSTSQQLSIPRTTEPGQACFLCCCIRHFEQTPNNLNHFSTTGLLRCDH